MKPIPSILALATAAALAGTPALAATQTNDQTTPTNGNGQQTCPSDVNATLTPEQVEKLKGEAPRIQILSCLTATPRDYRSELGNRKPGGKINAVDVGKVWGGDVARGLMQSAKASSEAIAKQQQAVSGDTDLMAYLDSHDLNPADLVGLTVMGNGDTVLYFVPQSDFAGDSAMNSSNEASGKAPTTAGQIDNMAENGAGKSPANADGSNLNGNTVADQMVASNETGVNTKATTPAMDLNDPQQQRDAIAALVGKPIGAVGFAESTTVKVKVYDLSQIGDSQWVDKLEKQAKANQQVDTLQQKLAVNDKTSSALEAKGFDAHDVIAAEQNAQGELDLFVASS